MKTTTIRLGKDEYADLLDGFAEVLNQADEDCEHKTKHLRDAIKDGKALHRKYLRMYEEKFGL